MRMLLVTAGSRGDVEPFVALAATAAAAGHDVRVAAPDNSGVRARGIDLVSLGVDYSRMIQDQGVSAARALRTYRTVVKPVMRGVITGAVRAALEFQPEVIVAHPKILSAPLIADRLGIPHVLVEMVPAVTPTRAFPAAGTLTADLGPFNRLTYLAASGASAMFRADLDEAARLLGMRRPRKMLAPTATLVPVSTALLARPDDWPSSVHQTGAWVNETEASELDEEVASFVSGGPFVYAGFGSMVSGDPESRGNVLVQVARAEGRRLLVATGLGGIQIAPKLRGADVMVVRSVAHDLVLPHASIAVHHGGIGTLHAATRAGTPSVIVPFIADQPFWATMMHRQGLAPSGIPQRKLTVKRLERALVDVESYRHPVQVAGEQLRTEHGTMAALRVLTALVA